MRFWGSEAELSPLSALGAPFWLKTTLRDLTMKNVPIEAPRSDRVDRLQVGITLL
ncbi:unnamed protein product, partial [Musa acuminata subsp. burmannicoides]